MRGSDAKSIEHGVSPVADEPNACNPAIPHAALIVHQRRPIQLGPSNTTSRSRLARALLTAPRLRRRGGCETLREALTRPSAHSCLSHLRLATLQHVSKSMFLTATATCMFGPLPEQSSARLLFDGSKPAETKPWVILLGPFSPGAQSCSAQIAGRGGKVPPQPTLIGGLE
jgi:hypothetical protein